MKSLIIYASSHGTAEDCAQKVRDGLGEGTEMVNINKERVPDLSLYDRIVLGGSVHAGQLQGKLRKVIKGSLSELEQKRLGLFLCSLENSREQFEKIFPEELRSKAAAEGLFGGRLEPEKLNGFFRFIMKKVKGDLNPEDTVDETEIARFTAALKG